jgi:cytochrome c biogenesis protein CcmG, thiol:disulfide interchange protein DsbE
MRNRSATPPSGSKARMTRTERRTADRAAERERAHKRAASGRRLSVPMMVGGIVTVLILVAFVVSAIIRSSATAATQSNAKGLTDPNAYHPSPSLLSTGTVAPDFTMTSAEGHTYHLAAQRGHPVLLEFYAVWCPVCHAEAPTIAKLADTYGQRGVSVWAILANPYGKDFEDSNRTDLRPADVGDLAWYATNFNAFYPQLVDPKFDIVNRYGIDSYPGLYVIGKDGKILMASKGRKSYGELSKMLNRALAAPMH